MPTLKPGDVVGECGHVPEEPDAPVHFFHVTRIVPGGGATVPAIVHWQESGDAPVERVECEWLLVCADCWREAGGKFRPPQADPRKVTVVKIAPWDGDEILFGEN